jgi:serine phosphatase RsbU (regulator of sigma subunit)
LVISNIAADAGLDVIQVRKIFEHQPSKSHFVFHLYIWPETLRSLTKHTANLQSYVISKDSKTLLSAKNSPTKPGTLFSSPNLALVVSGNAPMSSRSYEDPQRGPIIEVITSIPNTELHFVVERTSAAELAQIRQDVKMTALLSWIFVLLTLMASFLASQAVTKKINEAVQATLRIASGDLQTRIAADRRDEVGLLAMAVNHMASRIVTLLEVAVEAARQERELKTAQAVQKTLFKENERQGDIIAVQGHFEPASECAGDWWFDLSLSPTRRLVIIADATGHGASAALIVAVAYSYFQTLHLLARSDGLLHKGPASILSDLNKLLVQSGRGATTMTLFLADIDTETMTMRYTNAGHVPPILIPRAADDDRLPKKSANPGKKRVLPVLGGGVPLGFDGTSVFQEHETTVRRGDRLFFYTDGLIECLGVDGQSMTAMDLRRQLAELTDEDPEGNLCQTIVRLARERLGNTPRNDDITMVVTEICPFAAQAASPMHSKEGDAA